MAFGDALGPALSLGQPRNLGLLDDSRQAQYPPYDPATQQRLIDQLLAKSMGGLQLVGETLDKPGRAVRGLLAGKPDQLLNLVPFSDTLGLTDPKQATSGRDLLEQYGALGENQPGLDWGDVAGFGVDVATDPLTWLGGDLVKGGAKLLGAGAEAAAGTKLGAKVLESAPAEMLGTAGREAKRLFQNRLGNTASKLGQELYPKMVTEANANDFISETLPMWKQHLELEKSGQLSNDAYIQAMRAGGELGEKFEEPLLQQAAGIGSGLREKMEPFVNEARELGIDVTQLSDDLINYLPRYHHPDQWGGLLSQLKDSLRQKKDFFNPARLEFLKGLDGGTNEINDFFKDASLWTAKPAQAVEKLIGQGIEREQANKIASWVRAQPFDKYQKPVTDAAGAVTGYQWTGKNFFNADPIVDAIVRTQRHVKQVNEGNFIHEMVGQTAKKFDPLDGARLAQTGDWVSVPELFQQAGLKSFKTGGNFAEAPGVLGAEAKAAERLGLEPLPAEGRVGIQGLENFYVPREIAGDVVRVAQRWNKPEELKKTLAAYDAAMKLWKATSTQAFPAFHARNFLSNLYYNVISGAFDPSLASLKSAYALRMGQEVDQSVLAKLGLKNTTDLVAEARATGVWNPAKNRALDAASAGPDAGGVASQVSLGGLGEAATPWSAAADNLGGAFGAVKQAGGVGGKAATAVDELLGLGQKFGSGVEDIGRLNQYLGRRLQGWTPQAAALDTKKWLFDYGDLTEFERNVMKRVLPFYSWMRNNTPRVLGELLEKPGGALAQTIRGTDELRQSQGDVPEHIGERLAIPVPGHDGRYITSLGLPFEDALPIKFAPTPGKTLGRTAESLVGGATPPASFLYSLMSGREPYFGRPLSDLHQYPFENYPTVNLALSKFLGRPVSTTRRLTDERKGLDATIANMLTGLQITDLSGGTVRARHLEAQHAIQDMMSESPHLRSHTSFYADPLARDLLTDEEKQDLRLSAGLNKEGRDYAKRRTAAELFGAAAI